MSHGLAYYGTEDPNFEPSRITRLGPLFSSKGNNNAKNVSNNQDAAQQQLQQQLQQSQQPGGSAATSSLVPTISGAALKRNKSRYKIEASDEVSSEIDEQEAYQKQLMGVGSHLRGDTTVISDTLNEGLSDVQKPDFNSYINNVGNSLVFCYFLCVCCFTLYYVWCIVCCVKHKKKNGSMRKTICANKTLIYGAVSMTIKMGSFQCVLW